MPDPVPEDMALAALLRAATTAAPSLTLEALHAAYAIEKAHQFDDDREMAQRSLKRLVEDLVAGDLSQ